MKVILLTDVKNVGVRHDIKNVADGYAMNFLIPNKLAEIATPAKIEQVEEKKRFEADVAGQRKEQLLFDLKKLEKITVTTPAKANENGHLFKGVGEATILKALNEQHGIDLPKGSLDLPATIKEVGEHPITLKVAGQEGSFTLAVQALQE